MDETNTLYESSCWIDVFVSILFHYQYDVQMDSSDQMATRNPVQHNGTDLICSYFCQIWIRNCVKSNKEDTTYWLIYY